MGKRPVFSPLAASAAIFVLCVVFAVRASLGATKFLRDLNLKEGLMEKRIPPAPGPAVCPKQSQRVILIIIDGLRLDHSYYMDALNELRGKGVDVSAQSHYPSISRPNYVSLVSSVPPRISGVRMNFFLRRLHIDTIMDRLRAAQMTSAYVGDRSPGLPTMFRQETLDGEGRAFEAAHFATWSGAFLEQANHVLDEKHGLVILLPGRVDKAGHWEGAASDDYRDAVYEIDRELSLLLKRIDLDRETVIVTADHGHTDAGGHGGIEPEVMNVPLVMAGAGVRKGAAFIDSELIDIPPTVACLLGVSAPIDGFGRTLTEGLSLDPNTAKQVAKEDARRLSANHSHYRQLAAVARDTMNRARIIRMLISACVMLIALLAAVFLTKQKALQLDWRVILVGVGAFPFAYYALIAYFGQQFSPSAIPSSGLLTGKLIRYGLGSTAFTVIMTWYVLRGRVVLADRLAAANGLIVSGLIASAVPALATWSLYPPPHIFVPGPEMLFLIPATYIAVLCYSLACGVTIVLEIIVFFSRAIDPRVRLAQAEARALRARAELERIESSKSD